MSDGARSSSGAEASTSASVVKVGEERKDSCVPKFDALWFCYSPAHQLQQYYIHGKVDDCTSKWSELMDCLKKKTKYKEEVLAVEAESSKHPLWDVRTHGEAQEFWRKEFGHLSGETAQPEGVADGAHHSGRVGGTLV